MARSAFYASRYVQETPFARPTGCFHWSVTYHDQGGLADIRLSEVLTFLRWALRALMRVRKSICVKFSGASYNTLGMHSMQAGFFDFIDGKWNWNSVQGEVFGLLWISKRVTAPLCSSIVAALGSQLVRCSCATSRRTAGCAEHPNALQTEVRKQCNRCRPARSWSGTHQ